MDVEITPEPTEDERRAIVEALTEDERTGDELSPWRRQALDPNGPEDQ